MDKLEAARELFRYVSDVALGKRSVDPAEVPGQEVIEAGGELCGVALGVWIATLDDDPALQRRVYNIAQALGIPVSCEPPSRPSYQSPYQGDLWRSEYPYAAAAPRLLPEHFQGQSQPLIPPPKVSETSKIPWVIRYELGLEKDEKGDSPLEPPIDNQGKAYGEY